jgi:uncharacterized protein with PQ loop repeat
MKYQWIATTAAILSAIGIYPLINNVIITQDTKSFSYNWILMGFVVNILWIIYGISNNLYIVSILSVVYLYSYFILLFLKVKYEGI